MPERRRTFVRAAIPHYLNVDIDAPRLFQSKHQTASPRNASRARGKNKAP
jgi:hypothetical protein